MLVVYLITRYALPVGEETLNTDIGKRVFRHLQQYAIRDCSNVSPGLSRRYAMQWMTNTSSQHLGCQAIILTKDLDEILNQRHAVMTGIVQPADKGADISGTGQCRQDSLVHREAQGHIHLYILSG